MTGKNLKLGDLVSLQGLKKPAEGVLTVELGGTEEKPENINQLEERMSGVAEKMENNNTVQVSEITGLVEGLKKAMIRELLPKNAKKLLKTLKARFENKDNLKNRHPGIEWIKVQAKLEANPEKLWSLNEMEKTKGEPNVLGQDEKTGEYIFIDCSAESPTKRRNCVYDRDGEVELKKRNPSANYKSNAVSMAALMGINLLSESEYRELQTKGDFDKYSWSWLKTPPDKRRTSVALFGYRTGAGVRVFVSDPYFHDVNLGFRASLRV